MANRVNNWRELLDLANKDLKKYNAEIGVYDHDGEFSVTVVVNGEEREFADGYYEDELGDLINDAWAHVKAKVKPQMAYRVTAYYDMNISAEEEILHEIYVTEELAKARVAQLIKKYKDNWHTEEDADEWHEKEDSLEAYKDSDWNVDIFWMPEPIRNKID